MTVLAGHQHLSVTYFVIFSGIYTKQPFLTDPFEWAFGILRQSCSFGVCLHLIYYFKTECCSAAIDSDYRMTLNVTEFAFQPGGAASIRFDAVVTRKKGVTVLSESYWVTAPLSGSSSAVGVTALSEAAGKAFGLLVQELAAAL